MQKYHAKSLRHFKRIAKSLISKVKIPCSIILKGDLGAGKTTLINFIGQTLRINSLITSPTFTMIQSYKGRKSKFLMVNHFDLYRINNENELHTIGYTDYFSGLYMNFFEWGDQHLQSISAYSQTVYQISISIVSEYERFVIFECLKQSF